MAHALMGRTALHRGILAAFAGPGPENPAEIITSLQTDVKAFIARNDAKVGKLEAALDTVGLHIAAIQAGAGSEYRTYAPLRPGDPTRPLGEEGELLAHFGRTGEIRADLSIIGTGGGDLTKGGVTVFPVISDRMLVRQFAQSAIARLARRVIMTEGNQFEEPQDLGQPDAAWVAETQPRPPLDSAKFAFLTVPLHEIYSSQKITQRLLDDSHYNLGDWLANRIADKFGRSEGAAFMSGNGVGKPHGLTSVARSAAPDDLRPWGTIQALHTGTAGAFAPSGALDVLVQAVYALAGPYRAKARWIMNSKTGGAISTLKDADGRFLWSEAVAEGQRPLLLGYPVEFDENTPDIGASSPSIFFGDFEEAYIIVERPGLRLLRDPFSEKPHVIFYAYRRVGGGVQNTDAVKAVVFGAAP